MNKSQQLFELAKQHIPGGVNSPVRAFNGVGGHPLFIKRAKGAYIIDSDEHHYIDYVMSWGALIMGHAHPDVLAQVSAALENGWGYGAPTELEVELAQMIKSVMPSIESVRFVSSGTEAVMSAIRLARGFTGRNKIIKFKGCYHGHSDSLLIEAGSGALTLGVPSSAGVPASFAAETLVANYNALDEVESLFKRFGHEIAVIIVEPVAGNMNLVLPKADFLQGLRQLCDRYESVLIFDEVMTGFRVGIGGAQAHFGVKPDLTILGKIIGGGFPAAAFGGRLDIMRMIAPLGPVYQAGTLSGNPIAMTAGLATLKLVSQPNFYADLSAKTRHFVDALQHLAKAFHVPFYANSIGGMFGLFFTDLDKIENEQDVQQSHLPIFKKFFHRMLREQIYLAPSAYEAGFLSAVHHELEIKKTLAAAECAFDGLLDEI